LGQKGPGVFAIPDLVKFKQVKKPATRATKRPNPFTPGAMLEVKAKPASVKVRPVPLKGLRDLVAARRRLSSAVSTRSLPRPPGVGSQRLRAASVTPQHRPLRDVPRPDDDPGECPDHGGKDCGQDVEGPVVLPGKGRDQQVDEHPPEQQCS